MSELSSDPIVPDVIVSPVIPTSRAVRRRRRVWVVFSAGRFDRDRSVWRASLRRLRKLGSVVAGTEAAGRKPDDFRAALTEFDWDYAHLAGAAVGECYLTWDGRALELGGRAFARKLSDLTWTRSPEYGGEKAQPVHALVVPLRNRAGRRRVRVFVVVHMPLDNTKQRAAAWVDCCRGLVRLKAEILELFPGAELVIMMDGNKNLRKPAERLMVLKHLCRPLGFQTSWRPPLPAAGTHGDQVIDLALAEPGVIVACELVADDPSSDHRPFRFRLRGWVRRLVARVL